MSVMKQSGNGKSGESNNGSRGPKKNIDAMLNELGLGESEQEQYEAYIQEENEHGPVAILLIHRGEKKRTSKGIVYRKTDKKPCGIAVMDFALWTREEVVTWVEGKLAAD